MPVRTKTAVSPAVFTGSSLCTEVHQQKLIWIKKIDKSYVLDYVIAIKSRAREAYQFFVCCRNILMKEFCKQNEHTICPECAWRGKKQNEQK